jgi:hypothetical protein
MLLPAINLRGTRGRAGQTPARDAPGNGGGNSPVRRGGKRRIRLF